MRWLALLAVVVLAGCNGGTVDRHALSSDRATISSINCEAWLVARAVDRDRVTSTYAREQTDALRLQAANLADALATRPAATGLERPVRAAGRAAGVLADRLRRLRDHPSDRLAAAALARRFARSGDCS
jgi:hypothetical protein